MTGSQKLENVVTPTDNSVTSSDLDRLDGARRNEDQSIVGNPEQLESHDGGGFMVEREVPLGTTTPSQVQVLIVSGCRLLRESVANVLQSSSAIDIVGAARSHDEALSIADTLHPDVVVIDIATHRGLGTVRAIRAVSPSSAIVAFGVTEAEAEVVSCAEGGVTGYVGADASEDELVEAVERVARGEPHCSPRTAAFLLQRLANIAGRNYDTPSAPSLTTREREIASLLELGLSNKQIAVQLNIELATVKNHVHNILGKLGASTRGEAAARLRRSSSQYNFRATPPSSFPAMRV
jgi:two-component system, NarL family, nitrate/nitrite response regulator NarL